MNKKKLTIIIASILVLILMLIFLWSLLSSNTTIDSQFTEIQPPKNENAIIYLDNTSIDELSTEQKTDLINNAPNPISRQSAITSSGTPFINKEEGWGANLIKINDGSAIVEVTNISNQKITLTNNFVNYLGSNEDDTAVESIMETGANETLEPGQTIQVKVTNGGDAKYIKVGFSNYPLSCALIPVASFARRANDETQIAEIPENQSTYVLNARIHPYIFDKVNVGCNYSRKITETKYNNLILTKNEKQKYPYATLGYIELDIYNKDSQHIEITGIDYNYKQNGKIINTETSNFVKTIHSNTLSLFKVPFKFLGNGIRTTIILKTNIGNITINDPDTLFSVIKK